MRAHMCACVLHISVPRLCNRIDVGASRTHGRFARNTRRCVWNRAFPSDLRQRGCDWARPGRAPLSARTRSPLRVAAGGRALRPGRALDLPFNTCGPSDKLVASSGPPANRGGPRPSAGSLRGRDCAWTRCRLVSAMPCLPSVGGPTPREQRCTSLTEKVFLFFLFNVV